jgi:hypothetical protein
MIRTPCVVLFACATGLGTPFQHAYLPARYAMGVLPPMPMTAVGGGEVILEATVNAIGRVTAIAPLRTTPPFADLVVAAVRDWRFDPAQDMVAPPDRQPYLGAVEAKVLVVGVFAAPALTAPTLGEPPRDVAAPSDDSPFPLAITTPSYPPLALGGGVVLLEVCVGADGVVTDTSVIRTRATACASSCANRSVSVARLRSPRCGVIRST